MFELFLQFFPGAILITLITFLVAYRMSVWSMRKEKEIAAKEEQVEEEQE